MKKLEGAATLGTLVGYLLVSQQIMLAGLLISAVGSILWIIWARNQLVTARGIIVVNTFLLVFGILGLVKL